MILYRVFHWLHGTFISKIVCHQFWLGVPIWEVWKLLKPTEMPWPS